jgi:transcriptional regulator with XRE-family HTH domain
VKGGELRRFREEQGWTQDELAKLLRTSLGKGSSTTVGKWEQGTRPVPEDVAALVAKLQLESAFGGEPPLDEDALGLDSAAPPVEGSVGDTAPPEPTDSGERSAAPAGQSLLPGGSSYARVCEELWELVATGTGMVGAVTGSEGLRRDSEIILADKAALGRAWGKLAEQNDTFRRMLLGMTSGGAWLEVALVSGITFGKCYRSHQAIGERRAAEREQALAEWQAEHGGGEAALDGDSAQSFAQAAA